MLKIYGEVEGPLGFPMSEAEAKALDEVIQANKEAEYCRLTVEKAVTTFTPGERADVSWISTEAVDRQKDIVLASGMDNKHYKGNPIVTLAHDYRRPPVGTSSWQRKVNDNGTRGVKAKTVYPSRPEGWPEQQWLPDVAFGLVKAGLMAGKSIGFLTLEASAPTPDEVRKNPAWADAYRVVRKWLLLEYSVHWLPVNQQAVVEQVSKGLIEVPKDILEQMGVKLPEKAPPNPGSPVVPFTEITQVKKAFERQLAAIDCDKLAHSILNDRLDKIRGRV